MFIFAPIKIHLTLDRLSSTPKGICSLGFLLLPPLSSY
ncbi:hypothetical protein CAPGI0001_0667 [Capnocytophaga gingivalis ATCC 33624]|nr:hypothetical protein CAPGI0001_0667 [Capnocytophaga gingivalis ATCC 33624]